MHRDSPAIAIDQERVRLSLLETPEVRRQALARMKPEADALEALQLLRESCAIPAAITSLFGALPRLETLRPCIGSELPKVSLSRFDDVETRALARKKTVGPRAGSRMAR